MSAYCECPSGEVKVAIIEEEAPLLTTTVYHPNLRFVSKCLCLEMTVYTVFAVMFTDIFAFLNVLWLSLLFRNMESSEQIGAVVSFEYITLFLRVVVNGFITYHVVAAHAMTFLFSVILYLPIFVKMLSLYSLLTLRYEDDIYLSYVPE